MTVMVHTDDTMCSTVLSVVLHKNFLHSWFCLKLGTCLLVKIYLNIYIYIYIFITLFHYFLLILYTWFSVWEELFVAQYTTETYNLPLPQSLWILYHYVCMVNIRMFQCYKLLTPSSIHVRICFIWKSPNFTQIILWRLLVFIFDPHISHQNHKTKLLKSDISSYRETKYFQCNILTRK